MALVGPGALGAAATCPAPPRSVLGMEDVAGDLDELLRDAVMQKAQAARGMTDRSLSGRAVALVFEKPSTRTRISFDVGVQRLGGITTILEAGSSQLGRGESLEDTAAVLSRYVDCIVYRSVAHASVEAMARHATVPVVNALTDVEHPCQVLADLMTLLEHRRRSGHLGLEGAALAYVGDGNNMCHSYLLGAPIAGIDLHIATPAGYGPDPAIVTRAEAAAERAGTRITIGDDPMDAVAGVDAVATDTWVSMGDEAEAAARREAFTGYTVDEAMMAHAGPEAVFLHCLPGHWGEEATHAVAHGPRSLIYDEAENRMWAQMALLRRLVRPTAPMQLELAIR